MVHHYIAVYKGNVICVHYNANINPGSPAFNWTAINYYVWVFLLSQVQIVQKVKVIDRKYVMWICVFEWGILTAKMVAHGMYVNVNLWGLKYEVLLFLLSCGFILHETQIQFQLKLSKKRSYTGSELSAFTLRLISIIIFHGT